ncbi:TIGR03885 family FMN-dependent LLM class oxidoreductase [Leucobacter sp. NPDC077196]|uniref:TIGR03885 family FMN-dependent LLM class oxidoreductase n=1 Tax=Leucobacter sp. NPDC077196 TaxID=3154959 RepID=UPI003437E035
MVVIGYHASHEQHAPRELLTAVRLAEQAGFNAAMCSDHLAPWTRQQGESGFAWAWLGAAMATTNMSFGVVTAPGQRYHPVIVAQAIATLAEMFPNRFWAALGSGEALNEHVTGDAWLEKPARQQRLVECYDVMRRLLDGEQVSARGTHTLVHNARLWSRPAESVPLLGAAASAETAEWIGDWAEGLITVASTVAETQGILERYRAGAGRGSARLQVHVSLGASAEQARRDAEDQWAHSTVPKDLMWELEDPEDYEAVARLSEGSLEAAVVISDSAGDMADRIAQLAEGFDHVYLHHVGPDQGTFLRRCETELLPELRRIL